MKDYKKSSFWYKGTLKRTYHPPIKNKNGRRFPCKRLLSSHYMGGIDCVYRCKNTPVFLFMR